MTPRTPPKEMADILYNEVGEKIYKETGKANNALTIDLALMVAENAKGEWSHFTYRDIGNSDYWTHVILRLNELR